MKPLLVFCVIALSVIVVVALLFLILFCTNWPHEVAVRRAKITGIVMGTCGVGWVCHKGLLSFIRLLI